MKKDDNNFFRHKIQLLATVITNGNLLGYISGKSEKCLRAGAKLLFLRWSLGILSCRPLQAVIGKKGGRISFYVVGILLIIGSLFGRFVCGWLCPFGFFQDLLHKIPFPKKVRELPKEKILVKLKYLILLIFVIILPMYLVNNVGNGSPYFCKFICPAGTLEGGIPLVLLNKSLRGVIGFLFVWKNVILITIIILSIMIYRPFCKFICPLGAIYSLFNKVSFYRYSINCNKCVNCGKCAKVCMMNVDPVKDPNDLECIRCGNCRKACTNGAIELLIANKKLDNKK